MRLLIKTPLVMDLDGLNVEGLFSGEGVILYNHNFVEWLSPLSHGLCIACLLVCRQLIMGGRDVNSR